MEVNHVCSSHLFLIYLVAANAYLLGFTVRLRIHQFNGCIHLSSCNLLGCLCGSLCCVLYSMNQDVHVVCYTEGYIVGPTPSFLIFLYLLCFRVYYSYKLSILCCVNEPRWMCMTRHGMLCYFLGTHEVFALVSRSQDGRVTKLCALHSTSCRMETTTLAHRTRALEELWVMASIYSC
jgi:hypothetical protein